MQLEFSEHATRVIIERAIRLDWVYDAIQNPDLRTGDDHDPEIERFFKSIPDRDGRVLRVAINTDRNPWLVVTAFFDRAMKGTL